MSDYIEVSNEKNTNDTYGKQDVLSVSGDYGIVNQIEFQGRSFAGASVSNYGVVRTNDIGYTKSPLNSNPYGIIKTNKGKTMKQLSESHKTSTVLDDIRRIISDGRMLHINL